MNLEVEVYLAGLSREFRAELERIRKLIIEAAPMAEECISYRMPAFKHLGFLISYAAFKDHCSIFPGAEPIKLLEKELAGFKTSKGTIQFTPEKTLPDKLVRKIVWLSLDRNMKLEEARRLKKAAKKKG